MRSLFFLLIAVAGCADRPSAIAPPTLVSAMSAAQPEAEAQLAQALGIAKVEECHIGWFDVAQCNAVIAAVAEMATS